jgi:predicted nuclease of predicted toxin-antitoxin system
MRLLLDNNLSPRPVDLLTREGWDVAHVGALGLRAATDKVVLRTAQDDNRVLVSADTDFGALLAASHESGPSIVLVRRVVGRRVEDLAGILIARPPRARRRRSSRGCSVRSTSSATRGPRRRSARPLTTG